MARKLTATTVKKYKLVIDEWFLNNFNGKQAYLKFYPKVKGDTATTNFSKISIIPEIALYIQEKFKKAEEVGEMTHKDIVRELESFAMLDVTEITTYTSVARKGVRFVKDPNHIPKKDEKQREIEEEYTYFENAFVIRDFNDLTPVQRRSIKSVKEGKFGLEIEFFDKARAFEMLNKHKGFYQVDNEQKSATINITATNDEHKKLIEDIMNGED